MATVARAMPRTNPWKKAYSITLLNAFVFVVLAGTAYLRNVTSIQANCEITAVFLVGSVISSALLFRAGEGLVAIGFFVLGASLTFGAGTLYGVVAPQDDITRLLFSEDQQERLLATINFVNATSVFCVLICAWPMMRFRATNATMTSAIRSVVQDLSPYKTALIAASIVSVVLQILTFPQASNLLLRGVMNVTGRIPLIIILMIFARWSRENAADKLIAIVITLALVLLGIISTSKTAALLPLIAVIAGLWLGGGTRRLALLLTAIGAVLYFMVLAPLTTAARLNTTYGNGLIGLNAGLQNIVQAGQGLAPSSQKNQNVLSRFSSAPYQGYLIAQYQSGNRGHSLDDFWVALVPRILWPDKPNVTRFGGKLYGQLNQTTAVSSQLAPTYSAEAYWNHGWVGLIAVSSLIGLQLGWLSQKWLDLVSGRSSRPGVLLLAVPIAFHGLWVETWIAATYIGGFVTLFVLITAVDAVMQPRRGPAALRPFRGSNG